MFKNCLQIYKEQLSNWESSSNELFSSIELIFRVSPLCEVKRDNLWNGKDWNINNEYYLL